MSPAISYDVRMESDGMKWNQEIKITKRLPEMSQMTMCIWLKLEYGGWGYPGDLYLVRYESPSGRVFGLELDGSYQMGMRLRLGGARWW